MIEEKQEKSSPAEGGANPSDALLNSDLAVSDIASYYEEMVRAGILDLEVETPKGRLVLKRNDLSRATHAPEVISVPQRRKGESPSHVPTSTPPQKTRSGKAISSPIMGVFYRSASPQVPAFVKEGDLVQTGATLCIVEAMKVMNEIKADAQYKIVKISVDNGKPITQGQELFWVEPA